MCGDCLELVRYIHSRPATEEGQHHVWGWSRVVGIYILGLLQRRDNIMCGDGLELLVYTF